LIFFEKKTQKLDFFSFFSPGQVGGLDRTWGEKFGQKNFKKKIFKFFFQFFFKMLLFGDLKIDIIIMLLALYGTPQHGKHSF